MALMCLLLGLASGCVTGESGCPCGADTNAPFAEHDLSFSGSHTVDNACICQCGDADPQAFPKDRACGDYETDCGSNDRWACY